MINIPPTGVILDIMRLNDGLGIADDFMGFIPMYTHPIIPLIEAIRVNRSAQEIVGLVRSGKLTAAEGDQAKQFMLHTYLRNYYLYENWTPKELLSECVRRVEDYGVRRVEDCDA